MSSNACRPSKLFAETVSGPTRGDLQSAPASSFTMKVDELRKVDR